MSVEEQLEVVDGLPVVDFLDPAFRVDPHRFFRRLYEDHALATDRFGFTRIVFRFDDVERLLRDPRIGVTDYAAMSGDGDQPLARFLSSQLLGYDPPAHTRIRRLMSAAFTPRRVQALRERVRTLVGDLLDDVRDRSVFDVIADLSFPMPVIVICELLGVPPSDRELFKDWSADLAAAFDPVLDPVALAGANGAVEQLRAYLDGLIDGHRRSPRDGLLRDLIEAEEAGDRLSHEELICNTLLLLFAGHETTKNLVANGLLALLRHPDQLRRLRHEVDLLPNAVEEILRYDPPVGLVGRRVLDEVEIDGIPVAPGTMLALSLMAANRDPARNAHPDRFDITRNPVRHLSFGFGPHHCLGAPLARMEAHETFLMLLERFASIELAADDVPRQESFVLRGVESLPVSVVHA